MATSGDLTNPPRHVLTQRLTLRRWRAEDREPFAALNADPEVMRYFPNVLDRTASDAAVERIEEGFERYGYGLWAVESRTSGAFLGFTGLSLATLEATFTPAVEVGWRLARDAWGYGYATEAATAGLDLAFATLGLDEVVSFTAATNERSRAVMVRLGMTHSSADDFDHPALAVGHPLRRHVLYRVNAKDWFGSRTTSRA
jgi:RimJ/RimL family protein N-acetyltransferase